MVPSTELGSRTGTTLTRRAATAVAAARARRAPRRPRSRSAIRGPQRRQPVPLSIRSLNAGGGHRATELDPTIEWLHGCDHGGVTVRFQCETKLRMQPAEAFDLSLSVAAHLASMARSRERVVGHPTSDVLGLGDEVTWRAWHFGIPWRLTSRITAFDRPRRFVDEQVRGPFRRFHHEHRFEPSPGGSKMTDVVEIEAPVSLLGRVVERFVLTSYLRGLIESRNQFLAAQGTHAGREQ